MRDETDTRSVTEAFISERMTVANRGGMAPFRSIAYQSPAFSAPWVRSPTLSSGELDKVLSFPTLPTYLTAVAEDGVKQDRCDQGVDPGLWRQAVHRPETAGSR